MPIGPNSNEPLKINCWATTQGEHCCPVEVRGGKFPRVPGEMGLQNCPLLLLVTPTYCHASPGAALLCFLKKFYHLLISNEELMV